VYLRDEVVKSSGSLDFYLNKMLETKASQHHVHIESLQDLCVCRTNASTSTSLWRRASHPWKVCQCLKTPTKYPNQMLSSSQPRQYATEEMFAAPGPHILRPWMLPHRLDFGLRGSCDVETLTWVQCQCFFFSVWTPQGMTYFSECFLTSFCHCISSLRLDSGGTKMLAAAHVPERMSHIPRRSRW